MWRYCVLSDLIRAYADNNVTNINVTEDSKMRYDHRPSPFQVLLVVENLHGVHFEYEVV